MKFEPAHKEQSVGALHDTKGAKKENCNGKTLRGAHVVVISELFEIFQQHWLKQKIQTTINKRKKIKEKNGSYLIDSKRAAMQQPGLRIKKD